jgi:hemerythrin superfamily protein
MDALELLKQDHQAVKELFEQLNDGKNDKRRKRIFDKINSELNVHTHIEETVFYPEMERIEGLKEMVKEALDEHREVKKLLEEIETLDFAKDDSESLITELVENVDHHVAEEEDEMFPRVRELCDEATLQKLGKRLESAKGEQRRKTG